MRELTREAFHAWLRERGAQPCGERNRCPIATFLDLPPEGTLLSDGSEADSNEVAVILASEAAEGALSEFVIWADATSKWLRYGWTNIAGNTAADYLESLP